MEEISSLLIQTESDIQTFNEKTLSSDSSAQKNGEILKTICKIAPAIIAILKIAKIFVGRREKDSIDGFIAILEASCANAD